jgi:uncharacterized protein YjbI with pentapeptide repeats
MTKRGNRLAWVLAAVLAVVVLVGAGLLCAWGRSYWVARHHGVDADLRRAFLPGADLRKAILAGADLRGAFLVGADLRAANFSFTYSEPRTDGTWDMGILLSSAADLRGSNLQRADLRGARLWSSHLGYANLRGANLSDADLSGSILAGAVYDAHTRWPEGFDPVTAGAVLVR